jgi:pimeloyl-ACP methyl ester carboxylesterase
LNLARTKDDQQQPVKTATVGMLEITTDDVGVGERPLVLVHGFTGSRDDFADVLEPLGAIGRTLAPDLRGHGGSTNPGKDYSLDQLCADLAGFLDAMQIQRCDLLGHSLGGMIALRFVLKYPDRVSSLILMDTAARAHASLSNRALTAIRWVSRTVPMRWQWRFIKANGKRLPKPARRAALEMGEERYWSRIRDKLEAMDPAAFDELLRALVNQQPVTERLHEIDCPTLVIVGDQDTAFLNPSREMADRIPNAKLVVIEDAHHSPQIEARDSWLALVSNHIERVRA